MCNSFHLVCCIGRGFQSSLDLLIDPVIQIAGTYAYRSEVIAGPDFIAATLRQCYFLFREEGCGIYAGIGSLEHYLAGIIDRADAVIVLNAGIAVLGWLHKILPVKGALDSLNYFFITLIYSVHLHHISTVFP